MRIWFQSRGKVTIGTNALKTKIHLEKRHKGRKGDIWLTRDVGEEDTPRNFRDRYEKRGGSYSATNKGDHTHQSQKDNEEKDG